MRLIRLYVAIMLSAIFFNANGQISYIKIMIGDTESEVEKYMDSLFSLKHNSYYKIKRNLSQDGDLILTAEYALSDENFYTCSYLRTIFKRVKGANYCVLQQLMGTDSYLIPNINYIKDTFKEMTDSKWEIPYYGNKNAIISARFEKGDADLLSIIYEYNYRNN